MEARMLRIPEVTATEIIHKHIGNFSNVRNVSPEEVAATIEELSFSGGYSEPFKNCVHQFLNKIRPDQYHDVLELLSDHRYLDSEIMKLCIGFLISRVEKRQNVD